MAERSEELERGLPGLRSGGYQVKSPGSFLYNCFAWAVGLDDRVVECTPRPDVYWAQGIPIDGWLEDFIQLYEGLGFERCESADLEPEYEKVALYRKGREAFHAARQLESGIWTSKCGKAEDIEHTTLAALEGDEYGTVGQVMRRRKGAVGTLQLVRMSEIVETHEHK